MMTMMTMTMNESLVDIFIVCCSIEEEALCIFPLHFFQSFLFRSLLFSVTSDLFIFVSISAQNLLRIVSFILNVK